MLGAAGEMCSNSSVTNTWCRRVWSYFQRGVALAALSALLWQMHLMKWENAQLAQELQRSRAVQCPVFSEHDLGVKCGLLSSGSLQSFRQSLEDLSHDALFVTFTGVDECSVRVTASNVGAEAQSLHLPTGTLLLPENPTESGVVLFNTTVLYFPGRNILTVDLPGECFHPMRILSPKTLRLSGFVWTHEISRTAFQSGSAAAAASAALQWAWPQTPK